MKTFRTISATALCVLTLSVTSALAQQQTQDQNAPSSPIPAYRSPLAGAADTSAPAETQTMTPDTRSLSGVQNFSLGESTTRSYWQPHVDVTASADSNGNEAANSPRWDAWTSFLAGIDVHRTSGSSAMVLNYAGGGMFSSVGGVNNGIVQELGFSDKFSFRRSSITFIDQVNYLPESSLGFGGVGGATIPGIGAPGLEPVFAPGQSILTGRGQNLSNSFETEVDTFLTARTSLTFVGGYTLLHYFDSGLLNYSGANARAGYNYQKTRKDTVGVSYTYNAFRYSGINQSIDNHTAQLSYGRRVTGRLAFQIAAGPQLAVTRAPKPLTQIFWALNTSLLWQASRTGAALTYSHGVSGGSGVLTGSITDIATGSVTRQASRTFSSGILGGYSRNRGIPGVTSALSNQTYNYWFGGASFSRPVGRSLGLTLSYQLQYQTSNSAFCIGPTCGASVTRHLISFGVGWHERPLLF